MSSRAVWPPLALECAFVEHDVMTSSSTIVPPGNHVEASSVYPEATCQWIATGCRQAVLRRRTASKRLHTSTVGVLREQQFGRGAGTCISRPLRRSLREDPKLSGERLAAGGLRRCVPTQFASGLVLRQQGARSRHAWTDSYSSDLTPSVLCCI